MNEILTAISLLISIPVLASAVFFIFRGSLQAAENEALRKDNDDQDKRLARKELEIKDLEEDNADLVKKNELLTLENQRVWEQLTQKADVEGVKALLHSVISLLRTEDPS